MSYIGKNMEMKAYEDDAMDSSGHSVSKLWEEKAGKSWNRIVAWSVCSLLLIEISESLYGNKRFSILGM